MRSLALAVGLILALAPRPGATQPTAIGAVYDIVPDPPDDYSAVRSAHVVIYFQPECTGRGLSQLIAAIDKKTGVVTYGLIVEVDGLRSPGLIESVVRKGGDELTEGHRVSGRVSCDERANCYNGDSLLFGFSAEEFSALADAGGETLKVTTTNGPGCDSFLFVDPRAMSQLRFWAQPIITPAPAH